MTDHPPLQDVLSRASENEPIEWVGIDGTEETARELVDALQHHCRENGGAYRGHYRFREQWFFVSVSPRGDGTVGLEESHTHDAHDH